MRLIRGIDNLTETLPGCVATIGNFDGLHLGHQYILDHVKALASEHGLPTVVVTFEPQPLEFFRPEEAPPRLTSLREKAMLLDRFGIDYLVCLHFDRTLAALTARSFIERFLLGKLGLRALVIGDDFRFGQGRSGDKETLQSYGQTHGFCVTAMDAHAVSDERVSSTRVREALTAGDLATAARLLGRTYSNAGRVIHGDKRGHDLGVPTMNIDLKRLRVPLQGVYATRVHQLTAEPLPAVSYIGTRPVFHGRRVLLETHVFGHSGDWYGRLVEVEYLQQLRGDLALTSAQELMTQMQIDLDRARRILGLAA